MTQRKPVECWLTDMDGVLVQEERAIPGAADFIAALQRDGRPFQILTNNSIYTARDLRAPEPVAVLVDVLDKHRCRHLGYFSLRSSSAAAKNADAVFRIGGFNRWSQRVPRTSPMVSDSRVSCVVDR